MSPQVDLFQSSTTCGELYLSSGTVWGACNDLCCLQAIDFGRAIDLQLLPVGTQFDGVSTTEGMQCPEMLSGKSWHYCVRPLFMTMLFLLCVSGI